MNNDGIEPIVSHPWVGARTLLALTHYMLAYTIQLLKLLHNPLGKQGYFVVISKNKGDVRLKIIYNMDCEIVL